METAILTIFHYIDYRKYLQDWYSQKKAANPGYTHAYICRRLGQPGSKTYFNNVISGRRDVSTAFIDRFIELLECKPDEAKFFRALITYNQSTSPQEKEFCFDQLIRLNNTPQKLIDKSIYAYFKNPHHSVIRALLDIINFKGDYKALARHINPPLTAKQARISISLLKSLRLVAPDNKGFLKPTDKVITTGEFVKDDLIKQYQMKCLDQAKAILASDTKTAHRTISQTISLSDKAFERIMERIQQMKTEIRSIVHKDETKATKVYQLNMNLFPWTR